MVILSKIVGRVVERVVQPLEDRFIRAHRHEGPSQPPIFVVGPPRTGTTLIFQLLTSCFRTTYFCNLSSDWFPGAPLLTQKFSRAMIGHRPESYRSHYGRTEGWFAQAEATRILNRWFPHQHPSYVEPGSIDLQEFSGFRDTVAAVTNESGLPLVCKNAWNCFRLEWLHALFPTAVFVVVRRNIIDSAQSDLEAKIRLKNDRQAWNSASPKEYEAIRAKPYWEQVVDQQYYTWRQMEEDRQSLGSQRFIDVWYEHLCTSFM